MTFTNSDCPNDGEYTVTGNTSGCFGNSWYAMNTDHTGDAGGKFMLVNASPQPSDFYVDTVSGLCANTTFEFAAWVVNVLRPSACGGAGVKPNLTFRIETTTGTLLQSFDSGDIPSQGQVVWQQYGTFFKTPSGVSTVVLRIRNNAPGGNACGNDLALDDITFRPCGPVITATLDNAVRTRVDVCENQQANMVFTTSFPVEYASPKVQWQLSLDTGATWNDITGEQAISFTRKPTISGMFLYRAVMADAANFNSISCRIASNITIINVNPLPAFAGNKSQVGCTGSNFTLNEVGGNGFTYQWLGPNGFSSQSQNLSLVNVSFKDSGLYTVLVKTANGCARTDSFNVVVYPGTKAVAGAGGNICEGSSILLSASGGVKYTWSPATGLSSTSSANPLASPVDTTNYKVIVTNQYGCSDSTIVPVFVYKKPIVNAGPDQAIFEGDSVVLAATIQGNTSSFYWTPAQYISNTGVLSPSVSPPANQTYTLYAVAAPSCPAESDNVFVRVYKKLTIPNIFSPNGDGINDSWLIGNMDTYPNANLKVFTRTGQAVFEMKTGGSFWDGTYNGKPVPVGTYYYVIDLHITGQPIFSGWVVVIR